jgi:hypothetical protein
MTAIVLSEIKVFINRSIFGTMNSWKKRSKNLKKDLKKDWLLLYLKFKKKIINGIDWNTGTDKKLINWWKR